jgi:hypothetical protein
VLLRQKGEQNLIKGDETDQSLMKTDARLWDNSGQQSRPTLLRQNSDTFEIAIAFCSHWI